MGDTWDTGQQSRALREHPLEIQGSLWYFGASELWVRHPSLGWLPLKWANSCITLQEPP